MMPVFLTCCGLLTLVKRPPELHRLATLLHLLLNLPQLCPDLEREKTSYFHTATRSKLYCNEKQTSVRWHF